MSITGSASARPGGKAHAARTPARASKRCELEPRPACDADQRDRLPVGAGGAQAGGDVGIGGTGRRGKHQPSAGEKSEIEARFKTRFRVDDERPGPADRRCVRQSRRWPAGAMRSQRPGGGRRIAGIGPDAARAATGLRERLADRADEESTPETGATVITLATRSINSLPSKSGRPIRRDLEKKPPGRWPACRSRRDAGGGAMRNAQRIVGVATIARVFGDAGDSEQRHHARRAAVEIGKQQEFEKPLRQFRGECLDRRFVAGPSVAAAAVSMRVARSLMAVSSAMIFAWCRAAPDQCPRCCPGRWRRPCRWRSARGGSEPASCCAAVAPCSQSVPMPPAARKLSAAAAPVPRTIRRPGRPAGDP